MSKNTQCLGCRYANWQKTATGRLHPNGQGKCERLRAHPLDLRLPASFYWLSGSPMPAGGHIERNHPLREKCIFKDGSGM